MEETAKIPVDVKPEYIFILLPLFLSFLLLTVTFIKRRVKRDVRVNCWFCNENFFVPHGNVNCFDCPHCEQYNGFKEDGDYNKPIPAQYSEDLNFPVTGCPAEGTEATQSWSNGLCTQCNHNQAVKIKLVAAFQPVIQSNEDEELTAYVAHLENLYRLCWRCQVLVRTTLEQQNAELAPLLPGQSAETLGGPPTIETKTKTLERAVRLLVVLGESACLLCAVYLLWAEVWPLVWQLWASFQWPSEQGFPGLSFVKPKTLNYDGLASFLGIGSFLFTSALEKAQRGLGGIIARLLLWSLMLMWSKSSVVEWIPVLNGTFCIGDRFFVCLLLTFLSSKSLLRTITAKRPQQRIQKRVLRRVGNEKESDVSRNSAVVDWITACKSQRDHSPPLLTRTDDAGPRVSGLPFTPKRLQLDRAFDQMHISLTRHYSPSSPDNSQSCKCLFASKYEVHSQGLSEISYSYRGRSLLKPAQLLSGQSQRSLSQSSWVAGGLWTSPMETKQKPPQRTFLGSSVTNREGLLTPPPSLDGSQASQHDSLFNERISPSAKSVFEDCGRSWPPSHSSLRQRNSASPSSLQSSKPKVAPQLLEIRAKGRLHFSHTLRKGAIVLSIFLNLVVVTHYIWRRIQTVR